VVKTHSLKDGRQLTIREATGDDASALIEYVEAISGESNFISFGPGEFGMTVEEEVKFLEGSRSKDNQIYLVAEIDGEIVGSTNFTGGRRPRMAHTGEFGVSVRKAYWGLGVGSALLDALIEWAKGTDIVTKINLRVRADNERGIALYKRKGFVHEGTETRGFRIDGVYHDDYHMGLEL
jgi:RimJ/RimL family protein N-acetyltransferase